MTVSPNWNHKLTMSCNFEVLLVDLFITKSLTLHMNDLHHSFLRCLYRLADGQPGIDVSYRSIAQELNSARSVVPLCMVRIVTYVWTRCRTNYSRVSLTP